VEESLLVLHSYQTVNMAHTVVLVSYCVFSVQLELLNMEPTFLNRNVNEGFSGGEKKRNEILQLAVLEVRSHGTTA
jgi:Fe-S cluster assembly ATPase SufC